MGWLKQRASTNNSNNNNPKKDEHSLVAEEDNSSRQRPDYIVPDVAMNDQMDASTTFPAQYTVATTQRAGVPLTSPPPLRLQQFDASEVSAEITYWKRFCMEIKPCQTSWFHVKDPVNGRILDIPESFAPATCRAFFYKLFLCVLCNGTLVYTIIDYDSDKKGFYFAFLTHWGIIFCCLYSIVSLWNTILASRTGQPDPLGTVSCRIRTTWILFTLSSQTTFLTMILYWTLDFDPSQAVRYATIASHGVLFLFTVIDGVFVSHIPLRLMHWYGFILPFDIAYMIWTVLQSVLSIDNPIDNSINDTDPTNNDDAIYPNVLEWNNDWKTALFWSIMAVFVIGPILYILLWSLTLGYVCCWRCSKTDPRKYIDTVDPSDTRPTVDDVEEGSIFAGWK
jgi:hypothetical protein